MDELIHHPWQQFVALVIHYKWNPRSYHSDIKRHTIHATTHHFKCNSLTHLSYHPPKMPGDHGTWLRTWKALGGGPTIVSGDLPIPKWDFNFYMVYLAQWTLFLHPSGVIDETRISQGRNTSLCWRLLPILTLGNRKSPHQKRKEKKDLLLLLLLYHACIFYYYYFIVLTFFL